MPEKWPRNRFEKAGGKVQLPVIPVAAQMYLEAWQNLGHVHQNGFGVAPLPFVEIRAGTPWADDREVQLLRDMSQGYLEGHRIGQDPFGIAPYEGKQ